MIDTSGILIHLCGNDHRLKWSTGRRAYKHMEGDEARCGSTQVRLVAKSAIQEG